MVSDDDFEMENNSKEKRNLPGVSGEEMVSDDVFEMDNNSKEKRTLPGVSEEIV